MRYRISPHIEFNKALDGHEVIITDLKSQASFYINSTIQTFIQKFETPKTSKELTAEISKELCIAANRVKQIITPFFNYCKYRQFILPEKTSTTAVIQKPLFAVKDLIDVYSVEKVIDATSDADIYMAADTRSQVTVVIKLLKNNSTGNVIALKREYNFLLQLNNTHVTPKALAFHKHKHYCYFVQEFAGGASLPDFISHNKHAAEKYVISIAKEIIDAFATIHNKDIVHGDIHPSNIIIT